MRLQSVRETRFGVKRMMLVDHPQEEQYHGGVLLYMYMGRDDRQPDGASFFHGWTIDQVTESLKEEYGWDDWSVIPDQIPGCLDEWIGPVRSALDESGRRIYATWERLVGEEWVRFS